MFVCCVIKFLSRIWLLSEDKLEEKEPVLLAAIEDHTKYFLAYDLNHKLLPDKTVNVLSECFTFFI